MIGNFALHIMAAMSCWMVNPTCLGDGLTRSNDLAGDVLGAKEISSPIRLGESIEVIITAESAVVWDIESGSVLYEKNADIRRPVASLSKLLSALVVSEELTPSQPVYITREATGVQLKGANIKLPLGDTVLADDLMQAALVASANDAMVALAVETAGSEEEFVALANLRGQQLGLLDTQLANATGLSGGTQYSTAYDVRRLLELASVNRWVGPYLDEAGGRLVTAGGAVREYKTTDDLIASYLPIKAGKTGFTFEAKENVAILTQTNSGHPIGVIILGSEQRFQDAKIVTEWIDRVFSWSS